MRNRLGEEITSFDIELERDSFRRVLAEYFPNGRFKSPRILNACCGAVVEEPVVFQHFGMATEMVSVDRDENLEEITKAIGTCTFVEFDITEVEKCSQAEGKFDIVICRNPYIAPIYSRYITPQLSRTGKLLRINTSPYFEVPYKDFKTRSIGKRLWDWLVLENHIEDEWPLILRKLAGKIKDDGILFMTTFENFEMFRALELMKEIGYRIETLGPNPVEVYNSGLGHMDPTCPKDRYVIIAGPPEKTGK
jgi:hypothetical protein